VVKREEGGEVLRDGNPQECFQRGTKWGLGPKVGDKENKRGYRDESTMGCTSVSLIEGKSRRKAD
jgi:hypothetical protein